MRKFILACALVLTSASALAQDPALVGRWHSAGDANSLAGEIEFRDNGTFLIKPQGIAPAEGRFSADGLELEMALESSPDYPVQGLYQIASDGELIIQFKSGTHQAFKRLQP